jgi:hypothetical protein
VNHAVTPVPSCGTPPEAALLRAALALAARGWPVFPCAPGGKRPALRGNWQAHATIDLAQIRTWWERAPYNIGIACGPSRLVVIDLDMPSQKQGAEKAVSGAEALAALCQRRGQPFPVPTYAVDTPSGGCHLYYAARDGMARNSAGRLGPRVDVRAAGGYVIGAGSRCGQGAYTVADGRPPAPLPAWIAALLHDDPGPRDPAGTAPAAGDAQGTAYAMAALREETRLVASAHPGTRNDTLNRAAFSLGQLVAAGLLPPVAVITSLADAAWHSGLPEREARRTIRSGLAAGTRRPRNSAADRLQGRPPLPGGGRPVHEPVRRPITLAMSLA